MIKIKSSLKKTIITNMCLLVIIAFVYISAFTPFNPSLLAQGPVLKGNTGEKNIALQIAVEDSSDMDTYFQRLDMLGVKGTFFFL